MPTKIPPKSASTDEKLNFLMGLAVLNAENSTKNQLTAEDKQMKIEQFDLLPFVKSSDEGEYTDPRLNSLDSILKLERLLQQNGAARQQLVSLSVIKKFEDYP